MNTEDLKKLYQAISQKLKRERNSKGFWEGRLSSSALAGAVSITAFKLYDEQQLSEEIKRGLQWLYLNQNQDGGYGDSPESESNVSTSLLCYAAIQFCGTTEKAKLSCARISSYLESQNINLEKGIEEAVLGHYGKDRTFSVPILSMLAICGIIGSYNNIPQLPFELTLLPNSVFRFFNLQVVSYAIPALVAVGIASFRGKSRKNVLLSPIRKAATKPALRKLSKLLPESGGFLEAIPLTAFVSMCLIASDFRQHVIVRQGINFLASKQRSDGSWPIDTDLSSWVTTLSVKAYGKNIHTEFSKEEIDGLRSHLLGLQYKSKHPFNQAKPGGWGWTHYSGSVPDADDTPGAILALLHIYKGTAEETQAVIDGCNWLLKLQNRDGGIPTFCKGWGRLPFDSSCADLTGHAFLAVAQTLANLEQKLTQKQRSKYRTFLKSAFRYLAKQQHKEGYWLPLWFGNQNHHQKQNPVYGTAKVCIYLKESMEYLSSIPANDLPRIKQAIERAETYLQNNQNTDGSWGAAKSIAGTIEETALSIAALAASGYPSELAKGLAWLKNKYEKEGIEASPIGLYFASLWYDEKLYPTIYFLEALQRVLTEDRSE